MNMPKENGSWKELKDKLQKKIATLTDNDMTNKEDKKEEMFEVLYDKLDKNSEEMHKTIKDI